MAHITSHISTHLDLVEVPAGFVLPSSSNSLEESNTVENCHVKTDNAGVSHKSPKTFNSTDKIQVS